jgi:hypothetical protein
LTSPNNPSSEEEGFRIGDECSHIDEICNNIMPKDLAIRSREKRRAWTYHPQRFSICQNFTFWNNRTRQPLDYTSVQEVLKI